MPDQTIPDRSDGVILASREQRAREASRPPDERWCLECEGEAWHGHEPGCPVVRDVDSYLEGLATAVALDATIEAMKKEKR